VAGATGEFRGAASPGTVARLAPKASGETDLNRRKDELMVRTIMTRLGLAVTAAAVVLSLTVGATLAGEVKGPPNQINNTNDTGALDHANSACAASGLNDLDQTSGQTVSQVQTAADSWKYYGLPKGSPGTLGLCVGGTGER
jgi:hypothetical protein